MWALGKNQNLKESQRLGLANGKLSSNRPAPDKTSRLKEAFRNESAILSSDAKRTKAKYLWTQLEVKERQLTVKMWALGKDQNLKESQRLGLANAFINSPLKRCLEDRENEPVSFRKQWKMNKEAELLNLLCALLIKCFQMKPKD